ncbi:MAG: SCO family protein [Verrucomicrobia bacterium]|nr:SCO family protein [Verrucomicrobiota bacterium]
MRLLGLIALAVATPLVEGAARPEVRTGQVIRVDSARHRLVVEESPGGAPVEYFARQGDLELPWAGRRVRYEVLVDGERRWADTVFPAGAEELRRIAEVTDSLRRQTADQGRLVTRMPRDLIPDLALWDQEARLVFKKDLLGAPFALNFIFTSCRSAKMCPASTACMKQLGDELAKDPKLTAVRLVTITFDPEVDSPGLLRSYAQGYGIDPARHRFLTGDPGQIKDLMRNFGILTVRDDGTIVHNAALIVVNAEGRIVQRREGASFDAGDVAKTLAELATGR